MTTNGYKKAKCKLCNKEFSCLTLAKYDNVHCKRCYMIKSLNNNSDKSTKEQDNKNTKEDELNKLQNKIKQQEELINQQDKIKEQEEIKRKEELVNLQNKVKEQEVIKKKEELANLLNLMKKKIVSEENIIKSLKTSFSYTGMTAEASMIIKKNEEDLEKLKQELTKIKEQEDLFYLQNNIKKQEEIPVPKIKTVEELRKETMMLHINKNFRPAISS